MTPKPEKTWIKDLAYYSSLGLQVALSVFVGLFMGIWLDKWLDTIPILTFVFLMLGIFAGFRNLYRVYKKANTNRL